MGAHFSPLRVLNPKATGPGSRQVLIREASNEFVFAVVGHAGSGTTAIAKTLKALLEETSLGPDKFDVVMLRARDVIAAWAKDRGKNIPLQSDKRYLRDVELFQDYGDEMRGENNEMGLRNIRPSRGVW